MKNPLNRALTWWLVLLALASILMATADATEEENSYPHTKNTASIALSRNAACFIMAFCGFLRGAVQSANLEQYYSIAQSGATHMRFGAKDANVLFECKEANLRLKVDPVKAELQVSKMRGGDKSVKILPYPFTYHRKEVVYVDCVRGFRYAKDGSVDPLATLENQLWGTKGIDETLATLQVRICLIQHYPHKILPNGDVAMVDYNRCSSNRHRLPSKEFTMQVLARAVYALNQAGKPTNVIPFDLLNESLDAVKKAQASHDASASAFANTKVHTVNENGETNRAEL